MESDSDVDMSWVGFVTGESVAKVHKRALSQSLVEEHAKMKRNGVDEEDTSEVDNGAASLDHTPVGSAMDLEALPVDREKRTGMGRMCEGHLVEGNIQQQRNSLEEEEERMERRWVEFETWRERDGKTAFCDFWITVPR